MKISLDSINMFSPALQQGIKRIAACTGNAEYTDDSNIVVVICDRIIIGCFELNGERLTSEGRPATYQWNFSNFVIYPKYRTPEVYEDLIPVILNRYHGVLHWVDDPDDVCISNLTAGFQASDKLILNDQFPVRSRKKEYRALNRLVAVLETDADAGVREDALLSVEEAADLLGIGHSLMYKLVNSGEVAQEEGHKRTKIRYSALSEWIGQKLKEESCAG